LCTFTLRMMPLLFRIRRIRWSLRGPDDSHAGIVVPVFNRTVGFSVRESELFAKEILRRAVSGLADGDLLV
jgi:hypothetical protein